MTTRSPAASYKFVGAHLDNLADGKQLEPGDTVKLDQAAAAHPENQRLFDEGLLLEVEHTTKEAK